MQKKTATWIAAIAAFSCCGVLHAHHGATVFHDTTREMTLEGEVLRVEWVNPHRLLYLRVTNDKGEQETWELWGSANVTGPGVAELKERLQPGVFIVARGFPPRYSDRRVGAGEIRFPNGDVERFGAGPSF